MELDGVFKSADSHLPKLRNELLERTIVGLVEDLIVKCIFKKKKKKQVFKWSTFTFVFKNLKIICIISYKVRNHGDASVEQPPWPASECCASWTSGNLQGTWFWLSPSKHLKENIPSELLFSSKSGRASLDFQLQSVKTSFRQRARCYTGESLSDRQRFLCCQICTWQHSFTAFTVSLQESDLSLLMLIYRKQSVGLQRHSIYIMKWHTGEVRLWSQVIAVNIYADKLALTSLLNLVLTQTVTTA